jgi:hypothetical protein
MTSLSTAAVWRARRPAVPDNPRVIRMRAALALLAAALLLGGAGCATRHPTRLSADSLAEAETFPYFRLYWVGPSFAGTPLAAVDGRETYNPGIGDSVYYGDCVTGKGLLGGGSGCALPLQVTTVIYRLHSNAPLGPQRNTLIRSIPATIYDGGRSIELYSGRVAIDIFSDSFADASRAAVLLEPLNTRSSPSRRLPPPVYCPGLAGPIDARLRLILDRLPGRPCQRAAAAEAAKRALRERG